MGLKEFILANAIIQTLELSKKRGAISNVAGRLDELIDKQFPKRSEKIQKAIVKQVLLPLCRELMIEDLDKLAVLVDEFREEITEDINE